MTVEKAKKMDKSAKSTRPLFEEEDKKGDLQQLIEHVQANPLLYAVGAVIIVLVALAGVIYRSNSATKQREFMTKFAKALESEDPAIRATSLEPLAAGKDALAARAAYMLAETAYQAHDLDKAKSGYERVRADFPNSPYVADAVEGLGYIAENKADFQGALTTYKEILEKWPATFVGRRQNLNIGRCQEALGKFEDAKAAYEAQLTSFAGSSVYNDAKAALDRLRVAHPNLFPADTAEKTDSKADAKAGAPAADQKPADAAAIPAPAIPAPATPAPAAEQKPAEPAPAPAPATPAPAAEQKPAEPAAPAPAPAAPAPAAPAPK